MQNLVAENRATKRAITLLTYNLPAARALLDEFLNQAEGCDADAFLKNVKLLRDLETALRKPAPQATQAAQAKLSKTRGMK